jgi:Uma2 family endonuclease
VSIAADSLTERLIADLYKCDGKAEIVEGRIVQMSPTGDVPSSAGFAIAFSLKTYAKKFGGRAYPDNVAYLVSLPNRKSFSPDASYYVGPRSGAKFLQGAPVFAAEVRSENDYGPAAERKMAAKRADYFAAGASVVWDVDALRNETIMVYRANSQGTPTIYGRNDVAEAEPAVPGWKFAVNELFD